MRCNLTGDIAYVHVCKYMSLDPLDAPGHFWRQHDLSLSLGELPNNLGQPGELRWSLGSLRSQWPQESSLKVMPFPGKTIKKTISAKRDNPIYGVNWIVLWP